jgi:hypothetical protein
MRKQSNRSTKQARRNRGRSRVPEMPEEQARARTGRVGEGEEGTIIVSPTGTKHRPLKNKTRRLARSRAKSPAIGRQKPGRTAKSRRAQAGRADHRGAIGRS